MHLREFVSVCVGGCQQFVEGSVDPNNFGFHSDCDGESLAGFVRRDIQSRS